MLPRDLYLPIELDEAPRVVDLGVVFLSGIVGGAVGAVVAVKVAVWWMAGVCG